MRKYKFSEDRIAFALRQAESGTSPEEICPKLGLSQATFQKWKRKYAGMGVGEVRRRQQLEEETRTPKQLVADLDLDKAMLQEVARKKH